MHKLKRCFLFVVVLFTLSDSFAQNGKVTIRVQVQEMRTDNGSLYLSVFDQEEGYPSDEEGAILKFRSKIRNGSVELEFSLLPGEYAISVMHDENDNGAMDSSFIGIPKEGIGASNDAKGFMGPPSFDDAKFLVKSDPVTLIIRMTYLL